MKIRDDDLKRSAALIKERSRLMDSGRTQRDKAIEEIEARLVAMRPAYEDARFSGNAGALARMESERQGLWGLKNRLNSAWAWEVDKVQGDIEHLHSEYVDAFVTDLNREIGRLESLFDYQTGERRINVYSEGLASIIPIHTNQPAIDATIKLLIEAKSKIVRMRMTISLKELSSIYEDAVAAIPATFPLDAEMEISSETMSDWRRRREDALQVKMTPRDQAKYLYSTNLSPSGFALSDPKPPRKSPGDFWPGGH